MNLTRDKAIEAMDLLTKHGYSVNVEAAVFKDQFPSGLLYRVAVSALSFDEQNLRELCDLAESVDLECVYSLNAIRFYPRDDEAKHRKRLGAA